MQVWRGRFLNRMFYLELRSDHRVTAVVRGCHQKESASRWFQSSDRVLSDLVRSASNRCVTAKLYGSIILLAKRWVRDSEKGH